ncbi:NG,NG-dimethylarginine dimethylaminohydrolase (dimethylargininase) protein [Aliiroseovarius zhejiangensis]|uniref:NG,NG-dimethylarginine dimethylaminohydrolase (Dimethylargininase) protein n=1 Tax=Aliiroseovarius zhejiangensis TaxID=1632025 RepID=A0ABQ3IU33_9RHOB|nr:arginine deiminase family protein [Aliiroseovarius zhejiangensis]GHE94126.1 NG,NG-dimethylarginine dimethylaminohydrolase (dimethylargininase) protein [Aliiroseovarius zhejiangensis]
MTDPTYEFTRAITRRPSASITDGLRAEDTGTPDLDQMLRDHAHYVATLKKTGAEVVELPPLEDFPDAVFVEDTALCLPRGAVLMRPGAPSRMGEVAHMAPALRDFYDDVREIVGPGHIEGGDILVTGREILVGRSDRTDAAGVAELTRIVSDWGHNLREVFTPPGVLHFKTDCSLLDGDTILATQRLDASGCFDGYRVLHVADGEEAAANSIRFNQFVLMPAGFPRTAEMLDKAGFEVVEINNSECAKLDGGMSCLSLRF